MKRAASFCVLPTPPGNRLSPVKTCTPASRAAPHQGDAARGVPAQVHDLERLLADGHGVAVLDRPLHRDREVGGVGRVGHGLRAGRLDDLRQRPVVVPVPVRGDDGAQVGVPDQGPQLVGFRGRVDQQRLPGGGAPQQVGVVRHLADGELGDGQAGQLADGGRTTHLDVAGVGRSAHGGLPSRLSEGVVTVQAWTLAEVSGALHRPFRSSVYRPRRSRPGCGRGSSRRSTSSAPTWSTSRPSTPASARSASSGGRPRWSRRPRSTPRPTAVVPPAGRGADRGEGQRGRGRRDLTDGSPAAAQVPADRGPPRRRPAAGRRSRRRRHHQAPELCLYAADRRPGRRQPQPLGHRAVPGRQLRRQRGGGGLRQRAARATATTAWAPSASRRRPAAWSRSSRARRRPRRDRVRRLVRHGR